MSEITFSDLIKKTILIGLTYYTNDHDCIEQKQYWGTVMEANEKHIVVKLHDGGFLSLPPDLSSTKIAPPGEYRLRSTSEIVENPDYLSTWNINRSKDE